MRLAASINKKDASFPGFPENGDIYACFHSYAYAITCLH